MISSVHKLSIWLVQMLHETPLPRRITKLNAVLVLLSVLIQSSIQDEVKPKTSYNITQVAGLSVLLPCDVLTFKLVDIVVVLWYRSGSDEVIFSFDARKSVPGLPWSHESVWSHRATFQPEGLLLQNVQSNDQGVYRCRVDFTSLPTRNTKVALNVIVPPSTPIIKDRGRTVQSTIGPYLEGEILNLICESTGAHPLPELTWTLGDQELDTRREVENGIAKTFLKINNLHQSHYKANLTCWARNNNVTLPAYRTVTLTMNFPPLQTKIVHPATALLSGKMYHLECISRGAVPPAKITWWKANQKLPETSSEIKEDGHTSSSVLSFIPSPIDDGKKILCKSFSPLIVDKPMTDAFRLDVYYPPLVTLSLGTNLNASNIKEGDDIYLKCDVQSKSKIKSTVWKKNGLPITWNVTAGILISGQALALQKVKRSFAGYYSCQAVNGEGSGESNELYLDIKYKPVCKDNQVWVYGLGRREEAHVMCAVDSNPPVSSFHWIFNNSIHALDIPWNQALSDPQKSILSFTPMTEMDYGVLLCWSMNAVGRQRIPCVYKVMPEEVPEPVKNCSIGDQTDSVIQIICEKGYDGGQPQHFVLEVVDKASLEVIRNITNTIPVFYVTGLMPGALLTLHVYSVNSLGSSPPVVIEAGTLMTPSNQNIKILFNNEGYKLSDSKETDFFHITPILGALIGVIVTLMVIAIAIVAFVRCRSRKRHNVAATTVNKGTLAMLSANIMECHEDKKTNVIKCDSLDLSDYSEGPKYDITRDLRTNYDDPLEIERYTTSPRRMRTLECSHKPLPKVHLIGRNDVAIVADFSRRNGEVPLLKSSRPDSSLNDLDRIRSNSPKPSAQFLDI